MTKADGGLISWFFFVKQASGNFCGKDVSTKKKSNVSTWKELRLSYKSYDILILVYPTLIYFYILNTLKQCGNAI